MAVFEINVSTDKKNVNNVEKQELDIMKQKINQGNIFVLSV